MENKVLFQHFVSKNKIVGLLTLTNRKLLFITEGDDKNRNLDIDYEHITLDQYSPEKDEKVMIRLTVSILPKPLIFVLLNHNNMYSHDVHAKLRTAIDQFKSVIRKFISVDRNIVEAKKPPVDKKTSEKDDVVTVSEDSVQLINQLKLLAIESNLHVKKLFEEKIMCKNPSMTEDEFWGCMPAESSSSYDPKSAPGYEALNHLISICDNREVSHWWQIATKQALIEERKTHRPPLNLQKGKVTSILSDNFEVNERGELKITATSESIAHIFLMYPAVKKAYDACVPVQCTEVEFWNRYFKSKIFTRDKGVYVTDQLDKKNSKTSAVIWKDDMFTAYETESTDKSNVKKQKISHLYDESVDLTSSCEDYHPATMKAIHPGAAPLSETPYFDQITHQHGANNVPAVVETALTAAAVRSQSIVDPIIHKYNRNSEIVIETAHVTTPQPFASESDELLEREPPRYIELSLNAEMGDSLIRESLSPLVDSPTSSSRKRASIKSLKGPPKGLYQFQELFPAINKLAKQYFTTYVSQLSAMTSNIPERKRSTVQSAAAKANVIDSLRVVASGNNNNIPAVGQVAATSKSIVQPVGTGHETHVDHVMSIAQYQDINGSVKTELLGLFTRTTELLRHFYANIQQHSDRCYVIEQLKKDNPSALKAIPPSLISNAMSCYDKVQEIALKLQEMQHTLKGRKQNIMLLTKNMGRSDSLQAADINKMNVKVLDIIQDIDSIVYRASYIWEIYNEAIHDKYNSSIEKHSECLHEGAVSLSAPAPAPLMRTESGNHHISNHVCKYTYIDVNAVITSGH